MCPIVIQHAEQRGCGNTASGSARVRRVRPRRFDPHPTGCLHQSPRASSRKQSTVRVPNPRLRTPGSCESFPAAASKPRCNWRERFLSGSSLPRYARIAITPATVRRAHVAAIVGLVRGEGAQEVLLGSSPKGFGMAIFRRITNVLTCELPM
jgi:hypothetical protein